MATIRLAAAVATTRLVVTVATIRLPVAVATFRLVVAVATIRLAVAVATIGMAAALPPELLLCPPSFFFPFPFLRFGSMAVANGPTPVANSV